MILYSEHAKESTTKLLELIYEFSKVIYRLNTLPIKISASYFAEIGNLKIHMEIKGTQNSQKNLEKEERSWRTFIIYYKVTVIRTVWYWHKDRHVDQWNRV